MSAHRHTINDALEVAAKKVGIDGWQGYQWELVEGGQIVRGCVPDGVFSGGPRKGRPRFNRPIQGTVKTVAVSEADLDHAAEQYRRSSGKCWTCKGSGEVFKRWSREGGIEHATCRECSGSGQAAKAAEREGNADG